MLNVRRTALCKTSPVKGLGAMVLHCVIFKFSWLPYSPHWTSEKENYKYRWIKWDQIDTGMRSIFIWSKTSKVQGLVCTNSERWLYCSKPCFQCHTGSLKSAMVGVITPRKLINIKNKSSFPREYAIKHLPHTSVNPHRPPNIGLSSSSGSDFYFFLFGSWEFPLIYSIYI